MKIDRKRNCYIYEEFGHMAWYYRNKRQGGRVVDGRRLEYEERRERHHEHSDNLKEEENLESLD